MTDYPRSRRRRRPRFLPSFRQLLVLAVLSVAAVAGGFAAAYATVDVPTPNDQAMAQSSVVYYADGTTEVGRFGEANRRNVDLAQVPQHVQDAVLAAEDRGFYSNQGVSPRGIARALWSNVRNDSTQGGSTITQQYVKNVYLTHERTLSRKLKEWVIAVKVDQEQSKGEILEDYLNTIYWGRGAYGIETAAQAYFGVDAAELDTAQAAYLAGIIASPGRYDPVENPEGARNRWQYVVDGMVETGALTQAQADALEFPAVNERSAEDRLAGDKGYVLDVVRQELLREGFDSADLEVGGLTIVTTLDQDLQEAARAAVQENLAEQTPEDIDLHVALASVEPGTGALRAMYGGEDYLERQFNDAVQGATQPGSTFKPFALAAALEQGISLRTRFNGNNNVSFEDYNDGKPVANFGDRSFGRIDLVRATESSVNTAYVDLTLEVGPEAVLDAAVRAGIPEDTQDLGANPSIVLGTPNVRPVDLAEAYATFAAQGEHADWYVVQEVRLGDVVQYEADPQPSRVFDEEVVADVTYALQEVVTDGSGTPAALDDRPAAGKTGTTNNNRSAWFAGYVPQLSTVVAMWDESEDPSLRGYGGRETVTGGSFPAAIWKAYMTKALEGTPVVPFPERADVGSREQREEREEREERSWEQQPRPREAEPRVEEPEPSQTPTEQEPESPQPTESEGPSDEPVPQPSDSAPAPAPTQTGGEPSAPAGGGDGDPEGAAPADAPAQEA